MTRIHRMVAVCLLLAACGGDDTAGDDAGSRVDAGALADGADPVDAREPTWDGPDSLDVLVVEPGWYFGDDVPLAGALVMLDSPRGRLTGRTGPDGLVRLEGFSFAEGAVDVTVVADGHLARTLIDLDRWDEDRPLWMPMQPGPDGRGQSTEPLQVMLTRSLAGTEGYCWHDAIESRPRHHLGIDDLRRGQVRAVEDRRTVSVYPGLGAPGRVACLELDVAADGSRSVVSFADARATGLAALTFDGAAEVTRSTVRLAYPTPNPYAAGMDVEAFVDDERDDDFGVAVGVVESRVTADGMDELTLGWVASAVTGTPTLRVSIEGAGAGWSINNLPAEAMPDPIVVRDPPTLRAEADGTLVIEGAEWADDAGLFLLSAQLVWQIVVPRTSGAIRLPAPPDGSTWADVLPGGGFGVDVFFVVWSYDEPIRRDHWGGFEWAHHVTHSAWVTRPDVAIDL